MGEDLKDKTIEELSEIIKPRFRAKQIYHWIHKKHAKSFSCMTDLPQELREEFSRKYSIADVKILKTQRSKDKSIKYLLGLHDKNEIETVFISDKNGRITVCVSTQVGCPLACGFCATGAMGFKRNLTVSEILSQVYVLKNADNIVFMGMGEPFLNYANVLKSIKILNSKDGLNIGARLIAISTVGVPQGIKKLADENIQVRLAVSINSANDDIRSRLMPINRRYSLAKVRNALVYYSDRTGRRATLEYVMLENINDKDDDLNYLIGFCKGLDVNVNLIPYNYHRKEFAPSAPVTIDRFIRALKRSGVEAQKRASCGADILAACGQLAVLCGGKK